MRSLLRNLIFCRLWVRKNQNFSLRLRANVNVNLKDTWYTFSEIKIEYCGYIPWRKITVRNISFVYKISPQLQQKIANMSTLAYFIVTSVLRVTAVRFCMQVKFPTSISVQWAAF